MGMIDTIGEKLGKLIDSVNKFLAKDFLAKEAYNTIDGLKDCVSMLALFQNPLDASVIGQVFRQDAQYNKFFKKLHGRVAQEEHKYPTRSITTLCELYILELEYLAKYISANDELNKSVEIRNVKFSHATFMGLVEAGYLVERFAKAFLFKVFTAYRGYNAINGVQANTANTAFKKEFPWFNKLIDEQMDYMTNLMNSYCSPLVQPRFTDKIIAFFKGEAYDPVLFTDDNKPNTNFLSVFDGSPQISSFAIFGLPSLNIFRHGANIYINWQHSRILRKEYEKKWMENHKLVLEMQKREMDPNSAEFKKLEKVINGYSDLIAETTKDIDNYRNG